MKNIDDITTNFSGLYNANIGDNRLSISFDYTKQEFHVLFENKDNENLCEFTTYDKKTLKELTYFVLSTRFEFDPDEVVFEQK